MTFFNHSYEKFTYSYFKLNNPFYVYRFFCTISNSEQTKYINLPRSALPSVFSVFSVHSVIQTKNKIQDKQFTVKSDNQSLLHSISIAISMQ